jgi:2-polyprenyl-3-methyl-5-hydroxy-6-metoxy-1,4-benzoquinol methylase
MVYANPVPSELASGKYYDQAGANYYLSPAKLRSDYADSRFERELGLLRKHCAGGSVLDVGCSSGGFLYQLRKRFGDGYNVLGTDVSGPALDYAQSRGVPVRRGSFLDQSFPCGSFEAVTLWAVLEHLLEPARFLERASQLLQPGGVCFVLVPNFESLATRLLGARYRYIYPQHLNYFTRATLTAFVGRWFSVREVRSTHFNPVVLWQDWRHGDRDVPNPERAALLERTTALKQNPALQPIKLLYRLCEKTLGALNLADNLTVVLGNPLRQAT